MHRHVTVALLAGVVGAARTHAVICNTGVSVRRTPSFVDRPFRVILVPEEIRMPAPNDRTDRRLDLARRWRESGQSARAFAQEQGVTPWTLYYWRERLGDGHARSTGRRRKPRSAPRVSLAPVHVVTGGGEESRGDVEILLACGDRVRVTASVSVETLRRVVEILRRPC